MLKSEKNGFIEIIERNGLSSSSFRRFEKDNVDDNPGFILQLENSPLFFLVRTSKDDYYAHDIRHIKFGPGFPKSEYYPNDGGWLEINLVYQAFEEWLKDSVLPYLEEIELPDLWEQVESQKLFDIDPLKNRTSDEFTKREREAVIAAIDRFKELIENQYQPNQEQLEIINDRLIYMTESLDRLNKVDWQSIAFSTVISISIALSLDTENGKELFNLFKQAFSLLLEHI